MANKLQSKPDPKFCKNCGKPITCRVIKPNSYDEQTGNPEYINTCESLAATIESGIKVNPQTVGLTLFVTPHTYFSSTED